MNNRVDTSKSVRRRRATTAGYTIGGPVFIPGTFNADKRKLFFFWSQEFQRRKDPANERQARVPTALERQGDFSQSVDSSGNPFPYIRDYTTGAALQRVRHARLLPGRRRARADPGRAASISRGSNALEHLPGPELLGGSGLNYTSQVPDSAPRREDLLRLDYQATDNWRVTGRYMNTKEDIPQAYGTTWAGNGSDQLPTPVLFLHPGTNCMLSATGHPERLDLARAAAGAARTTRSITSCSATRCTARARD